MVKQNLLKELEISDAVDLGIATLTKWTKKELASIRNASSPPVCVRITSKKYIVGNFDIHFYNSEWKVDSLVFSEKRSAILYCVLRSVGNMNLAQILSTTDRLVMRLQISKECLREKLDTAHKSKDMFRVVLFENRFAEVKDKLVRAKIDLGHVLNMAKIYI